MLYPATGRKYYGMYNITGHQRRTGLCSIYSTLIAQILPVAV